VYVTAFYTDEIPVSGGPESFGGLPGMILGLGIPRLHATWFAKKIINKPPADGVFAFPSKGKSISRNGLEAVLQKSLKDWGKDAQKNIWWTLL
nr:GLPGLI family protein [Chitinophagaceae bacterium]